MCRIMEKNGEQKMLDSFYNNISSTITNSKNIYCHNSRSKDYPDICFEGTIDKKSFLFSLEAKKDNKNNTWNYAKQLFGEILMNKKNLANIDKYDRNTVKLAKKLGIFLSYDYKKTDKIYKFLTNNILPDDWNLFGSTYGVEYVFLYDSKNNTLYYTSWNGFLVNMNSKSYKGIFTH